MWTDNNSKLSPYNLERSAMHEFYQLALASEHI